MNSIPVYIAPDQRKLGMQLMRQLRAYGHNPRLMRRLPDVEAARAQSKHCLLILGNTLKVHILKALWAFEEHHVVFGEIPEESFSLLPPISNVGWRVAQEPGGPTILEQFPKVARRLGLRNEGKKAAA